MRLTDWRGNEYGVGDIILYPRQSGRCVEMCEAVVERIWEAEGQSTYRGRKEMRVSVRPTGRGARGFYRTNSKTVYLDAKGNPTTWEKAAEDTSQTFTHQEYDSKTRTLVEVPYHPKMTRVEPVPIKPVTITNIENITVPETRKAA